MTYLNLWFYIVGVYVTSSWMSEVDSRIEATSKPPTFLRKALLILLWPASVPALILFGIYALMTERADG